MLKELFNLVSTESLSLDEILIESYNQFLSSDLAKQNPEFVGNFDLFRRNILEDCGIDEYDYYTKSVNPKLKKYVEENVYPEYNKNDLAHGIIHVKAVVVRAFALNETLKLGLNHDIIYAMSSYHDLGKYIDHETHEKIAAKKFIEDENMKKFFSDADRKLIMEAIEDHRSSFEDVPRSDYGKLISSADRNTRVELVFVRSFFVGQWRTPEMNVEEFLDFTFKRLSKRYGSENPENMFYADETYTNFLAEMRALLSDEVAFKQRYCEVNKISSRNELLINEQGGIYK